jgi:hypothetical protein
VILDNGSYKGDGEHAKTPHSSTISSMNSNERENELTRGALLQP